MYHTIPISRVTDVVKGAKLYKLTSPLPPRHLDINSTCYYCGNRNVSYWSEEPNLQGNMQLRNSRWPICQKILSSSRSLLKCSNCIISKTREPKLIKFHTDCFFIGPTWAGERICPNLKSDLAAKDPGLQCALSTTPASSEI